MPNHFSPATTYVVCAPDELRAAVPAAELPELLRTYGPEELEVSVQLWDCSWDTLEQDTRLCGVDDLAKYYLTTYTSPRTGLVVEIGWDT